MYVFWNNKKLESESLGIFKCVVLEGNLFWFMEWIVLGLFLVLMG